MLTDKEGKIRFRLAKRTAALTAILAAGAVLLSSCGSLSGLLPGRTEIKEAETSQKTDRIEVKIPTSENGVSERPRHMNLAEAATRKEIKDGEKPLSTMEIAQTAQPTVVAISTTGLKQTQFGPLQFEGAGSGVIVSEDGYIVTNNHVIANAKHVDVILASGQHYEAKLVGADRNNDLAVVKINAKGLPAAKIGNSDDLMVGELAVAVGNPLGDFQGTVTAGIISSLGRTLILEDEQGGLVELRNLVQTDAAINSGNSGGGLFNSYGELIGINVAKVGSSGSGTASVEGLGFAIPTNTAAPVINALVNQGHVPGQSTLNIRGNTVNEQMARSYRGLLVVGVLVREIAPGSAVAQAGLEVGDIITKFAGEKIYSVAQLNIVKNRHRAGDKIKMTVFRKGKYLTLEFALDEMK